MITCERAKELLSDYLEDELAPDFKQSMEAHLKVCPGCQQLGAQVKFITAKLHAFEAIHTSESFDQQLRNRIINDPKLKDKSFPVSFQKLSYGFSGVAILAALYFFVMADGNTSSPTAPTFQAQPGPGNTNIQATPTNNNPTLVNQAQDNDLQKDSSDSARIQQSPIDQNRIRLIEQKD